MNYRFEMTAVADADADGKKVDGLNGRTLDAGYLSIVIAS